MKKTQFSKILVAASCIIFVLTVVRCLTADLSGIYDASIYVTAIATTGGIFGSSIIWYEKKAQAENVSKIKLMHAKELTELEWEVYRKKAELQGHPGGDPGDMADFHVDEMKEEAFINDSAYLENRLDDAASDPEIQTYG